MYDLNHSIIYEYIPQGWVCGVWRTGRGVRHTLGARIHMTPTGISPALEVCTYIIHTKHTRIDMG